MPLTGEYKPGTSASSRKHVELAGYQKRTTRQIPVFVLEPMDERATPRPLRAD